MAEDISAAIRTYLETLKNTIVQGLYQEVIFPLAIDTLNELNKQSGIHEGEGANSLGKFTLSQTEHKIYDICDELAVANNGNGPGIYPLDFFDSNKAKFGGCLAHENCHCSLEPLSNKKEEMAGNKWTLQITDTGIVFINDSEQVTNQIEGTGAQVENGVVTKPGTNPDPFAEALIAQFQQQLTVEIPKYLSTKGQ